MPSSLRSKLGEQKGTNVVNSVYRVYMLLTKPILSSGPMPGQMCGQHCVPKEPVATGCLSSKLVRAHNCCLPKVVREAN